MSEYQPIETDDVKRICVERAKHWAIVIAHDHAHDRLHCATYGVSSIDKVCAASIGEFAMQALGCDITQVECYESFRKVDVGVMAHIERLTEQLAIARGELARMADVGEYVADREAAERALTRMNQLREAMP